MNYFIRPSFNSLISDPQRRQGVVDSLEVCGQEIHPKASGNRQEPPAEAIQCQEEPSNHAGPDCAATAA